MLWPPGTQIAPVVDASSGQSRADVLLIFMAAVLLLTGLQWLSVKQRDAIPVEPSGITVAYLDTSLPPPARAELQWCADVLKPGALRVPH